MREDDGLAERVLTLEAERGEGIWDRNCRYNKQSFPGGSEMKEFACNVGDLGSIPRSGRSPGEGNGNPLQYSCLENSMDRPWGHEESDTTE